MTKKKVQNLLKHLVCLLLCLTVILPFYMVVINSFKSKGEASRMSLALPKEWLFSNYTEVIDKGNLEVFILKHLYIVAQSHEIKGFEPVIIGKGYDKPHNNRDTHKNQETHKIGQDEKITLQPFFLKFSFRHSRIFCHILILS